MKEMKKVLGKICSVKFGMVGYQDTQLGISFTFEGNWGGVTDSTHCFWDHNTIEYNDRCNWTEKDRDVDFAKIMRFISDTLHAAKVSDINKLKGIPVEVSFEGNTIKD